MIPKKLVLVTGATGYIGGCLIPQLLSNGYRVRCLARNPARIRNRPWFPQVEAFKGDITDRESLAQTLEGVSAAYYLVHNMSSGRHYHERDISAAQNFASAAEAAGAEQIIYLGGLADPEANIGQHMRSRLQTGNALRQGSVPVTEFRASPIIGSGSISFEMIRYITEQFPALVGPRWLHNLVQPIAIQNVLDYLLAALETPACRSLTFEIGGREILTFAETMLAYARLRGLKRRLLTLPGLPVWLMALGVDILTPVPASIARPLIGGLRTDCLVRDDAARRIFPDIQPVGYQQAIATALSNLSPDQIEPVWDETANQVKIIKHAGFLIEYRQASLKFPPEAVYRAFTSLNGKFGHQEGDQEPARMMRLRVESRLPGAAWLEWRVRPVDGGGTGLSQTVFFAPKGVLGFFYWYLLYPIYRLIFAQLIKKIARLAGKIQVSE